MKNLTESLERKYSLDEAFDDSMPLWLAQALGASAVAGNFSKIKSNNGFGARLHNNPNADKKFGASAQAASRADYQQARGEYGGAETYGLAGSMLNNGIDISKVKVEERPLPDKILRASKKRPEIDIYHFDNGQVWARGYNDREICQFTGKTFGASSSDELVTHLVDYAVIQQNDSAIGTDVADLRQARLDLKRQISQIPNYIRNDPGTFGADPDDDFNTATEWGGPQEKRFDKSGYNVRVNIDRYVKIARELEKKKYVKNAAKFIEEAAASIEEMKSQLASMLDETDITKMDYEFFDSWRQAASLLNDASERYNTTLRLLDQINATQDEREKMQIANDIQRYIKDITAFLDNISSRRYFARNMKTYADWL